MYVTWGQIETNKGAFCWQKTDTLLNGLPRGKKIAFSLSWQGWGGVQGIGRWDRTMSRLRSTPVAVPHTAGDQVLTLWKCAAVETERQRPLNQWMIDWLERCAVADWRLLPDDSTVQ